MSKIGVAVIIAFVTCLVLSSNAFAEEKKQPFTLCFPSKMGDVEFQHKKHFDREGKCDVCHTVIFPEDAKEPLNYKNMIHKEAELKKSSCAACHVAGGKAFESKGKCENCHPKKK